MAIPISQLETWTRQGAVATAQRTYASIQTALTTQRGGLSGRDLAVYLQGSYKNDTNIRGDSAIDVVVQLNSVFGYDTSGLAPTEKQAFQRSFPDATYTWATFRTDVLAALKAYYGADQVAEGNKSITIARGNGRLAALVTDVEPTQRHVLECKSVGVGRSPVVADGHGRVLRLHGLYGPTIASAWGNLLDRSFLAFRLISSRYGNPVTSQPGWRRFSSTRM